MAASGGQRSPFGFEEAFKGGRGIQGGKRHSRREIIKKFKNFQIFFRNLKFFFIVLKDSPCHKVSKNTLGGQIWSEIKEKIIFVQTDRQRFELCTLLYRY